MLVKHRIAWVKNMRLKPGWCVLTLAKTSTMKCSAWRNLFSCKVCLYYELTMGITKDPHQIIETCIQVFLKALDINAVYYQWLKLLPVFSNQGGAVKLPLWLNLPLKLNKWLISVILLIGDKLIFAYPWYMYLFVYRKTIRADKESQRQKWRGSHATKGRESSKNASTATQCTELHVQVSEGLNILCQRYGG